MARIVLLHGAATTSAVWRELAALLDEHEVVMPDRPRTGNLARELEWLAPIARNRWVVGISGGATLGLALAASDVPLAGAVLHEPAVGSLLPDLLAPMRAAFASGGTEAFGRELYGPSWDISMAHGHGDEVTSRELAMFSNFEPAASRQEQGRIVITVGERSPVIRHRSVAMLSTTLGYPVQQIPEANHFVAVDHAAALATVVSTVISTHH